MKDYQVKMDRVLTHAQGFVRRYEIVKESMDGAVVQVTVRAFIGTAELDKDLEAMGLLMARKGMPRTLVLIAEQNIGMAAPRAAWMRGEDALVSTDLRIAETTVLDALKNGGFGQLIDPEIAARRRCRWEDRQRNHQRPGAPAEVADGAEVISSGRWSRSRAARCRTWGRAGAPARRPSRGAR